MSPLTPISGLVQEPPIWRVTKVVLGCALWHWTPKLVVLLPMQSANIAYADDHMRTFTPSTRHFRWGRSTRRQTSGGSCWGPSTGLWELMVQQLRLNTYQLSAGGYCWLLLCLLLAIMRLWILDSWLILTTIWWLLLVNYYELLSICYYGKHGYWLIAVHQPMIASKITIAHWWVVACCSLLVDHYLMIGLLRPRHSPH